MAAHERGPRIAPLPESEFHQHTRIALACGLSQEDIVRTTRAASAWEGDDATLITSVDELVDDRRLRRDLGGAPRNFQRAAVHGPDLNLGRYTLVSMVLNSLGVETEDGSRGFPS